MATVAELLTKIGFSADTRPLEKIEQRLEGLNHKLRLVVGAEVIKKLYEMTSEFGHGALELENTAAAAGLTTDAMQRLQFAVAQAGGNTAELGMTMTHLARMIQGAKMGAEDALQTFYLLGISQAQVASFRSTEDALYGVMDALQKIPDPLRRQAMMDRALGQGSRGLGKFALAGTAAAKASEATAKRIGALVPHGALDSVAKARASMDALGLMFKAISTTIASMFAPVITHVVGKIEDFYTANKAILLQSFEDWTVAAASALGGFVAIVEVVGGSILRFIGRNHELIVSGLKIAGAIYASSKAFETLSGAVKLLQGAWSAISGMFAVAPYALTAVGIALVAAAVHDLWALLTGGKAEDTWLYKIYGMAGNFFSTGAIGKMFQGVMENVAGGLGAFSIDLAPNVQTGTLAGTPGMGAMQQWQALKNMQRAPVAGFSPAGPTAGAGNSSQVTVNSTNTFNVPAGLTVEQTQQAATAAVRDSRVREYEHALVAQRQAFAY